MGYFITNGKKSITYNLNSWPLLLELSFHYGWTPKGTKFYLDVEWNGTYETMNGAIVDPDDALNFAAGLEKALQDIPDIDEDIVESILGTNILMAGQHQTIEEMLDSLSKHLNPTRGEDKGKLLTRFATVIEKEKLREFIQLCKEGKGFTIN